ncbi:WD40 repeat domain-containing protein [Streptomyces sp. NPDC020597]|uniref:WD40 repeat domain-containing protein n=1 Tax=unclassified Streptomyces TaxID=2593676 RepID=UPI0037A2FD45
MSGEIRRSGPDREGAAAGGRSTDPGWLVHGDPELILADLDGAAGQEETPAAAVYRTSGHVHRDAGAGVRRQVLALDAARYGNRELARDITGVAVRQGLDDPWVVQWATGSDVDSRLRYALPVPAEVSALATVVVEGRGIAVAGCKDGTLHAWDLATGSRLGKAVTARSGAVDALATAVLDGRPVAVTAGFDRSVRVWDLARGELVGECSTDDDSWVKSLAAGLVEGRPVVVGACVDDVVRVWDLATLSQHTEPLTIRTGFVSALATAVVDGRPVAVTSHSRELGAMDPVTGEETVRLWDLIAGRESGPLGDLPEEPPVFADRKYDRTVEGGSDGDVQARRCASLDINAAAHFLVTDPGCEDPMAVSANAYEVRVWNLATQEQACEPAAVFVQTAAVTVLDDRPAVLVAYGRGAVGVWDLPTLRPLQPSLTGHEATVRGTATVVVNRRQLAVTGGDDRSVRIWDLDSERRTEGLLTGHVGSVTGLTTADVDGSRVIVTGGSDTNVRIWDLDGKGQIGELPTGYTAGVDELAAGTVDGRPTLLTRGDWPKTVRIWDLTTRQELPGRSTSEYTSLYIDFFAVVDGRFVGVTGEGRVWDLTESRWIGVQPRQRGALALERLEGRSVVLTSHEAEGVHLWDLATGELLAPPLTGHTSEVRAGATGTLDGRPVVVAGGDRTVWTWDAGTGQQIGAHAFPSRIRRLTVAPDGRLVVGFGADVAVLTHRR